MNKIILSLYFIFSTILSIKAQSFLNKIPPTASMVMRYSGENFSKNLPLKKIDSYPFVKDHLFKLLNIDSLESLQNTGIDFEKDSYQYIIMEDSAMSLVSLLHLQNLPRFIQLLDANHQAEMKPEKKNGFEFLSVSASTYIGWNKDQAILVMLNYQNPNRYNYYSGISDTIAMTTEPMQDPAVGDAPVEDKVETIIEAPVEKPAIKKPSPGKKKPATGKKNTKRPIKKSPVKAPPVEIYDEEVTMDTTSLIVEAPGMYYEDSLQQARRDAWEQEQKKIAAAKQRNAAENIINNGFNGNTISIENDISYKKMIDPAADVSMWFSYENILKQYWSSIFSSLPRHGMNELKRLQTSTNDGFKSGMNVYFDKDMMRVEQKSFSPDKQMANLGKDLFDSKQSNDLVNYVNPDNIGYLSMSINSEAMATYYYKLMKQYLSSTPYMGEYADLVDIYIDLMEIIIDEKAIAELMPGNCMFVLHDMKTKQVTYTTYEYDDDFKSNKVEKTKQELSPNFTFVMETKREGFMQKLVNLPLKYVKKGNYNYQDKGGYYELVFDEGKYPLSSIYFIVKNGKLIITTSKTSIDMTLNNTAYSLDAETKNSILKNNYSLKINSKKLMQQISPELNTGVNQKISTYLEQNLGDVKMESRMKNGMMQSTTTMNITGSHANSLEFFFNMIDAINNIMEKDKQDKEQKIN